MTPGALEGLTVLDLATFVAAPFCCTLLGEFGADVIKVEQPGKGDDLRRLGRPAAEGLSYWWLVKSRNKKSITCNLRTPEGQDLLKRLAARTDILAENFRPGTMERWNLGYEALQAVNRGLIMVRISAFGQTGPNRQQPGFGRIAAAVSGMSYICGFPDRPPIPPGTPTVPDYLAGTFGALGALMALQHRHRTGEGQVVDVGLYEPMMRMLDETIPLYGAHGYVRERIGSSTGYVVPHNHYQTRDGKWIAIACTNDRMFERLVQRAMQRPALLEAFPSMDERMQRREELEAIIRDWVAQYTASDALGRLADAEVPSSMVNSVRELFEDPHMQARHNILEFPNPLNGLLHMVGVVPKLSRTPGTVESLGPVEVGAHNEEIYCGRLGLSRDDLEALQARGII
jgi:crotonobetainyl-CoA:carnitine CoA-transferase CaiB-like acyl-CoA transferase